MNYVAGYLTKENSFHNGHKYFLVVQLNGQIANLTINDAKWRIMIHVGNPRIWNKAFGCCSSCCYLQIQVERIPYFSWRQGLVKFDLGKAKAKSAIKTFASFWC